MPVYSNRYHTISHFTQVISAAILVALIALGVAACGSNGSGSPTTTPAAVQKCGTVHTYPTGKLTDPTAAKSAEDCFWQAYQKCQPATLGYSSTGVDTYNISTFTITSTGGQCSVTDANQFGIAPATPAAPKTYACTSMTQQQDGLHITACGSRGDILVPAPTGM